MSHLRRVSNQFSSSSWREGPKNQVYTLSVKHFRWIFSFRGSKECFSLTRNHYWKFCQSVNFICISHWTPQWHTCGISLCYLSLYFIVLEGIQAWNMNFFRHPTAQSADGWWCCDPDERKSRQFMTYTCWSLSSFYALEISIWPVLFSKSFVSS